MSEIMCRVCGSNPPAVERTCAPCWRDKITADREKRHAQDRERLEARRSGRPAWRPEVRQSRNHGHGTERVR